MIGIKTTIVSLSPLLVGVLNKFYHKGLLMVFLAAVPKKGPQGKTLI